MKHLVLLLVASACSNKSADQATGGTTHGDVVLDPQKLTFNGHEYTVRPWEERFEAGFYVATEEDSRKLVGKRTDSRQLSPCPKPRVISLDANNDGKRDVVFYTCGFVEIYADHASKLHLADPYVVERKEKHWVDLDAARYPGLAKLEPLIHQIDPDLE